MSEQLADRRPSPEDECRKFRTACAPERTCDAALASIAQGIPVARLGWSDHERSSAHSRSGGWNGESPVGAGTREAQAIDAAGARPTTSCTSDLHDAGNRPEK